MIFLSTEHARYVNCPLLAPGIVVIRCVSSGVGVEVRVGVTDRSSGFRRTGVVEMRSLALFADEWIALFIFPISGITVLLQMPASAESARGCWATTYSLRLVLVEMTLIFCVVVFPTY